MTVSNFLRRHVAVIRMLVLNLQHDTFLQNHTKTDANCHKDLKKNAKTQQRHAKPHKIDAKNPTEMQKEREKLNYLKHAKPPKIDAN